MTEIGRSTDELSTAPGSTKHEEHSHVPRMHALLESLTHSLDLACRGYLCAPLVDCDPLTDPECGPTGKKLQFPERSGGSAGELLRSAAADSGHAAAPPDPHLSEHS